MKRLDNRSSQETYVKVNITGNSGTGKSWFGASSPRPLILLSEYQGMASIQSYVAQHGCEMPMVMFMESMEDYRNVVRSLSARRTKGLVIRDQKNKEVASFDSWPSTIVIDSLTDALELVRSEIWNEAPPARDAQGLQDESYKHRKALLDRCVKLIKAFRNVPFHVVFLSLLEERDIYKNRRNVGTKVMPQTPLSKDLPSVIMAAVNICGVTYRKHGKYVVMTDGDDMLPTKRMIPIEKAEVPDFSDWVRRIQAHWQPNDRSADAPKKSEIEEESTSSHGTPRDFKAWLEETDGPWREYPEDEAEERYPN